MGAISLGGISMTLFSSCDFLQMRKQMASVSHGSLAAAAADEDFWFHVQQAFGPRAQFVNLNNGGVSPQPLVVQESLMHYTRIANQAPAFYLFGEFTRQRENIRKKLAQLAGCSHEELALCRNTTEAAETIIFGMDLQEGDEVLTTTQDYPTVMAGLEQRARRNNIHIRKVNLPVPAENPQEVVDIFRKAITAQTRLLVFCHINYTTGQIMPVRELCDMAHKLGIEVLVDGAHAFAHLDFKIPDLHCDYFATSLHKWLCAPFGCGMLYVKKDKIGKIWSLFGSPDTERDKISKFEHLGTRSFPAELAINEAIDFHNGIGAARKEARLRYLKNYWAEAVRNLPRVRFHTSLKKEFSCGLCSFSIEGLKADVLHHRLFDEYRIFTTVVRHKDFEAVRVTPHVYTKLRELEQLIKAIKEIHDTV
ncbi:MAG: isopenicillin-N epimerase [Chitinophagales bacterium]|nr:MAG: isopenicillin-N epimerase [Chitinophagales bacterium]